MESPPPTYGRAFPMYTDEPQCPFFPFSLFDRPCPTREDIYNVILSIAILSIAMYLMGHYADERIAPPTPFVHDPKSEDTLLVQRQKWAKKHGYQDIYESFSLNPRPLTESEQIALSEENIKARFANAKPDPKKLRKASSWIGNIGEKIQGVTSEVVRASGVRKEGEEAVLSKESGLGGHKPRQPISDAQFETARKEMEVLNRTRKAKEAMESIRPSIDAREQKEAELEEAKEKLKKTEEAQRVKEAAKKARVEEDRRMLERAQRAKDAEKKKVNQEVPGGFEGTEEGTQSTETPGETETTETTEEDK